MEHVVIIATNPNFGQLIWLLAVSILLHEFLYVCNRGPDHISRCVAPVFGLRLTPHLHSLLHILLIIAAASLFLTGDPRLLAVNLILLTLTIASYSIRLSNHLLLSWFFFLIPTIDFLRHSAITGTTVFGIRSLVILTYLFAAFHKLNGDYFNRHSSCGVRMFRFYLGSDSRHRWKNSMAVVGGIWLPVILEITIPILLLFEQTRIVGVLLALLLQVLFGFARNAHFSVVMCAGLTLFIPQITVSVTSITISCVIGAWMSFRFSMWKVYPFRYFALMLHAMFGALVVYLVVSAISTVGIRLPDIHQGGLDWFVISALLMLFALNGLSPYYSSKTEFSLAMFSNLRPDRWSHFVFREPSRQKSKKEYVEIVRMHGMPELTRFPRASMSYKLLRTFTPYQGRKYLKYYLVESIRNLRAELPSDFLIEFTDGSSHFQISSASDASKLKHQKLCLMPAVIPKDAATPYCN